MGLRSGKYKDMSGFNAAKHNRDVELTDLLAELAERYQDILRPYDLERIKKLVKDD